MKKLLYILNISNKVNSFSEASIIASKECGIEFYICGNWGYKTQKEIISDEKKYGIKIYQVDFHRNPLHLGNIKAYRQLMKIMYDVKFDCVHCNTPVGGVIGRICAKKNRIDKVIYQAHGFHFYKGSPKKNWIIYYSIERFLAHYTDALITMNKEDYNIAKKFKLRNSGKVCYVPGVGIDLSQYQHVGFRDKMRAEMGLSKNDVAFISMGDLIPRKNYVLAIESISKLIKDYDNLHYFICGIGPESKKLRALVDKYGVKNNIHFLGYRSDIKDLLRASDIFFFTSLQEGLPRSTMEAMASQLPVACSRIRGNTDLIDEGKGGVLFNPKDVSDIYEKLKNLLQTNYKSMGIYNLGRIRNFSLDVVSLDLKKIYQEEIEGIKDFDTPLSE